MYIKKNLHALFLDNYFKVNEAKKIKSSVLLKKTVLLIYV